ncbi:DUF4139 domain-containing protein [bacterium]|nr:MAG: DUF4139 domain-containing protein [bacterium]
MRSRILASVVRKKRGDFIYLSAVDVMNSQKVNGRPMKSTHKPTIIQSLKGATMNRSSDKQPYFATKTPRHEGVATLLARISRSQPKRVVAMFVLMLGFSTFLFAQGNQQTTAGDRTSVDLTIYNQNLSLIREERPIRLIKGMNRVILPDIPATIDGTSLHFLSLTDPAGVRVLEQNYQYDLVHQAKLLERYIGKEVEFIRVNPQTKQEYTVRGKLIATGYAFQPQYGAAVPNYYSTGGMIAEVDGKIEINPAGRLVLPALSEGLILRPRLEWLLNSNREGQHKTEISYLAGQLNWTCNYVALLNSDDSRIDVTGWVTLTNNSGTSFRNAGLKLVAGDVNVVKGAMEYEARLSAKRDMIQDASAPQFRQTELFEYKLYSLQRRTDLNNNETKQIELASANGVTAHKVFIYDGLADQWRTWYRNYSYRSQGSFGQQSNTKVGVYVTFKNELASGLGIPLPKGKVRVYKRDDDGKEQFIGEDNIDHTPKDEEVRLYLGNAFDIVGERAQKDFKSYASGHVVEETIEIKLRNHKEEQVEVQVYEHPWRWSQWEIVKSNADWTKVDQTTLRFPVKLEKGAEKMVSYTIRYTW